MIIKLFQQTWNTILFSIMKKLRADLEVKKELWRNWPWKCFHKKFPKAKIKINLNDIFEKLDDAAVDADYSFQNKK